MDNPSFDAQQALERLGYKTNEAKVYVALLQMGNSLMSEIAASLQIPRSSVQVILDRLYEARLVTKYQQKRYTYWEAETPKKILDDLQDKAASMRAAMPSFAAMKSKGSTKTPSIKILRGWADIQALRADILKTEHGVSVLVPWDIWCNEIRDGLFAPVNNPEISFHTNLLTTQPSSAHPAVEHDARWRVRYLPERFNISDATILYGSTSVIISFNKKETRAIVMDDPDIFKTKKLFFEELWNLSKER